MANRNSNGNGIGIAATAVHWYKLFDAILSCNISSQTVTKDITTKSRIATLFFEYDIQMEMNSGNFTVCNMTINGNGKGNGDADDIILIWTVKKKTLFEKPSTSN